MPPCLSFARATTRALPLQKMAENRIKPRKQDKDIKQAKEYWAEHRGGK